MPEVTAGMPTGRIVATGRRSAIPRQHARLGIAYAVDAADVEEASIYMEVAA